MDANQALDLLHSTCVQPQNLGLHGRKLTLQLFTHILHTPPNILELL